MPLPLQKLSRNNLKALFSAKNTKAVWSFPNGFSYAYNFYLIQSKKDVAKKQNAFTREIKATSILCVKNFILGAFAAPIP